MAGRLLMARLKVFDRTAGPSLIKRCSLADDANKAIFYVKAEMKDHKHILDSKITDLDNKFSSEFALLKESFESHKKFTENKIDEAQLIFTRYHLGAFAVFAVALFTSHLMDSGTLHDKGSNDPVPTIK